MKRIVSILLVLLLSCTDLFPIFAENRSEKDFYNDEYTFKDCKLFYKFEPLPFGTSCKGTFKIKNTSNKPISNYIIKFNLKNLIDDYNGAELDEYDEENDLYTFLSMDDEIKPNFTKTITFYYETDADGKVYKAQNIRFMTLADMNSTDTDNDGLNDFWEEELKTDPTNPDTDMDGLTDGFEFNKAGTDPLNPNSEDPKVNDADLDPDFDSLKNIEEQNAETDPLDKDSDGDTLSDYNEINKYATSPILSDTDMDGLTDDYEIKIGLNPNNPITDGVTPDGKRTFDQTSGEIAKSSAVINSDNWLKPSVSGNVNGNIDENIKIDIASYDAFSDNKAAVSDILLIKSNYETPLKLNFTYDTPYVGDINNLSIVQYSTEDGLELLDTVISEENKSISAEINGGGMYFVLDVDKFLKGIGINVMREVEKMSNVTTRNAPNLNETIRYDNYRNIIERMTGSSIASTITTPAPIFFRAGGVVGKGVGKADIVFVIDSTGSMSGAIGNVTYNINDFADKLTFDYGIDADFALIDYKDITIDGKDSTVLHKNGSDVWYTDPDELKTALSKLSVGGGGDTPETPIDALQLAQTLNFRADAAKFVILLTDAPYKMDNVSEIKDMSEIASNLQKNNMYVAVIAYDKDEYKELLALKDSLYGNINADFSETLLQIVYMLDQNVNDGTWVILDDFQSVKLNKSDSLFTDTDKDGLSDKKELGESMQMNLMPFILKILKSHSIPETLYNGIKEITVWKYKSNPVLIDTDYDGIPDGHIDYDGSLVKPDKRPRKKMFKNITLSRES